MSEQTEIKEVVQQVSFKRNADGLINGLEYKFKSDGRIDWRAMIKSEHLVFNRQYEQQIKDKYGKDLSELKVTDVDDRYLLILLAGIKNIAKIRGYTNVSQNLSVLSERFVASTCKIQWVPNIETNGLVEEFSDAADATTANTNGFGNFYLTSIAANRAFVRAVRNYLEINIVGFDEVSNKVDASQQPEQSVVSVVKQEYSIASILEKLAKDLGYTFESFKEKVIANNLKTDSNPSEWKSFATIPSADAYTLTDHLGKAKEAKESKKIKK